jgi:hypothetical protein
MTSSLQRKSTEATGVLQDVLKPQGKAMSLLHATAASFLTH